MENIKEFVVIYRKYDNRVDKSKTNPTTEELESEPVVVVGRIRQTSFVKINKQTCHQYLHTHAS